MKNHLFVAVLQLFLLQLSFYANAQSFDLKWANTLNKTSMVDFEVDANGNCYVVGTFADTVDFDLGTGVSTLIADTAYPTFLAKYDANGNFVFVKQLPGLFRNKLALDKTGNIWLTAVFEYTVDFDPGAGVANLTAYQSSNSFQKSDVYIAKYDNNGNYLLAFSIVDSSYSIRIEDITTDNNDNLYLTGDFRETVDFDPSASATKLTANDFNGDVFIAKYSSAGNLSYAHHLVAIGNSANAHKIRIDNSDNVYICGRFIDAIDLDPSTATYTLNTLGGIDGFVAKYNSAGAFQFGGNFNGVCRAFDVEPNGDFYVGGTMPDSMDADWGTGTSMLYSMNNFDIWLAHYDNTGSFASANAFESNAIYHTYDFYINPNQEVLMSGYIRDTVDFDPGNSGGEFISNGNRDVFVSKFDDNCDFKRGMSFGAAATDQVNAIAGNNSSDFWIIGSFSDSVDFDPSSNFDWHYGLPGTFSIPNGGFLARYNDPDVLTAVLTRKKELLDVSIHSVERNIYIDFSNLNQVNAEVEVYTMSGQLVIRQRHSQNNQLIITDQKLSSQIYLVKVKNENAVQVRKVMLR